ncbi:MAG: DNA-formamidopyrimidine glycosylase [Lactobacillales bacterium]|jgi:formamidopyrimidine-DNA glycosylase|nr:DNA-formamidopyrimidine glycosylase [Lactobacillales bacterium]
MPELPEVEIVRRGLIQLVKGKTIQEVQIIYDRIIAFPLPSSFSKKLQDERIDDVRRRGKFLIFKLRHYDLISHLRMEGKYVFSNQKNSSTEKHTHVIFIFTDGSKLSYKDARKFGRMVLVEKDQALSYRSLQKLGPEPVESEFLFSQFWEQLARSKKSIKTLLLEQKIVVGLGNIYVDECLWQAKIHPEQKANTLLSKEATLLREVIIETLSRAIKLGGTTIRSYKNALGKSGHFQSELKVYGRKDKSCFRCGDLIQKISISGRGTHFCPTCQKLHAREGRVEK